MNTKTNNLNKLLEVLKNLNINPKDLTLYKKATTHPSRDHKENYRSLAFYGDSLIYYFVSKDIFENKNNSTVKKLSNIRRELITNKFFTRLIKDDLKLEDVLLIDENIKTHLGAKSKVWANMFEAIVGAINEDLGDEATKKFIETVIINKYKENNKSTTTNKCWRTKVNDLGFGKKVKYKVNENKSTRDNVVIEVFFNNKQIAIGIGNNLKTAKENAASNAYEELSSYK